MTYRTKAIHNMAMGLWDLREAKDYIHTQATLEGTRTLHKWLGGVDWKQVLEDEQGEYVAKSQGLYD